MATGGNENYNLQNVGQDEDNGGPNCSSCDDEGQVVNAVMYCVDCEEYLCKRCLKSHARYNQGHEVLDESMKTRWGEKKQGKLPTERCPTHIGEILQIYCENHEALCCHVCVAMNHSSCNQKRYIPEVAKDVASRPDFQTLQRDIANVSAHLQTVIEKSKENKESIAKSRDAFLENLRETRLMFESVYNQLEEKSRTEGNLSHLMSEFEIDGVTKKTNELIVEVKDLQQQVNPDTVTNESQLYINMKQVAQKLKGMISKVEQVSKPQPKVIEYEILQPVSNLLKCSDGLYRHKVINSEGVVNNGLFKKRVSPSARVMDDSEAVPANLAYFKMILNQGRTGSTKNHK